MNTISCPHCHRVYNYDPVYEGRNVQCKNCKNVFLYRSDVPAPASVPAPSPSAKRKFLGPLAITAAVLACLISFACISVAVVVLLNAPTPISTAAVPPKVVPVAKPVEPEPTTPTVPVTPPVPDSVPAAAVEPSPQVGELGLARPEFSMGGLSIGDPLNEEWLSSRTSSSRTSKEDTLAWETIEVSGTEVTIFYQFYDSRLESVHLRFDSDVFDELYEVFVDKMAEPNSHAKVIVTTKLNVPFENQIVKWDTLDGEFVLAKYGDSVTEGFGAITSEVALSRYHEREEAEKQELRSKF